MTDKMSAAMQIAERVYSLAQEQDDPTLMTGAYNTLAATLYWSGDFESAQQYAMSGIKIWRSGSVRFSAGHLYTPAVGCLGFAAMSEWHLGEIASCQANIAEAISLAKELNDANALALALTWAALIGYFERKPAEVEHCASELIELSTRQNFAPWLALGTVCRGWARSVSGDTTAGISWIEDGIGDWRATGATLTIPFSLAVKAEALHLADRTAEALESIGEAQATSERSGERWWYAELHRLRGVFLAALGADETQIGASFSEAIKIAREQKSVSLEKRAQATYAEYRRQKASASGGCGFRLPLG